MKNYRGWVYRACFWFFGQLAAMLGLILSGDIFYKEGCEFDIEVKEIPTAQYAGHRKTKGHRGF